MPTPSQYANDVRDAAGYITGKSATKTGEYYRHIYSQDDVNTGVPVVGVELDSAYIANPTSPVPIQGLTDAQILDIVLSDKAIDQDRINTLSTDVPNTQEGARAERPLEQVAIIQDGGGLPLGGIIVFGLLLAIIWFVYSVVRVWQNNQAQKMIMRNRNASITEPVTTTKKPTEENDPITLLEPVMVNQEASTDWRTKIELSDKKLKDLLTSKGISGDSVSDQLKAVGAGTFASVDLAWEAHQAAKKLLKAHNTEIDKQAIKRTLQLFKQVFAEHDVI